MSASAPVVSAHGVPSIAVHNVTGEFALEEATVAWVAPPLRTAETPGSARALGRTYSHRFWHGAGALDLKGDLGPESPIRAGEGGAFDLWEVAARRPSNERRNALRLSFRLHAEAPSTLWLGLGCSDNCALSLNDALLFSCSGRRYRQRDQDSVELELRPGDNELRVYSWKTDSWANAPTDHFSDDWAVEAKLYPSAQSVWARRTLLSFHVLDTPVVHAEDDLRAEGTVTGREQVELVDLSGRTHATGHVGADGSVTWSAPRVERKPFLGLFELGGDVVEPVIVTRGEKLETLAEGWLRGCEAKESARPWALRVRHLLKPEFVKLRDAWWARKLAISVMQACREAHGANVERLLQKSSVARIKFEQFASGIDGTHQYYRVLEPDEVTESTPVAVLLPTAPAVTRPYLQSYQVADLMEAENWASAARESKIALFWPGYVDVDYGGAYSFANLSEIVRAFEKRYPKLSTNPRFVVGFCSGGVSALGYALAADKVDGLVLCTPVVHRPLHRWFRRMPVDPLTYPATVLAREDWQRSWSRLTTTPLFINYDADVPGHGEPKSTRELLTRLQAEHAPVESYWPSTPDNVLVWGTRARDRAQRWFEWINKQRPTAARAQSAPPAAAPVTVKEALLRGFQLDAAATPVDRRFRDWWLGLLERYRGERPARRGGAATMVRFSQLSAADWQAVRDGRWLPGPSRGANGTASVDDLSDATAVWGFRLLQKGAGRFEVEVVHSPVPSAPSAPPPGSALPTIAPRNKASSAQEQAEQEPNLAAPDPEFPRIDLMVDGSVSGALFARRADGWHLWQLSFPDAASG